MSPLWTALVKCSMHFWSGGTLPLTFHSLKGLLTPLSSGPLLHCYAISMSTFSLCNKLLIFQIGHLSLVPGSKTRNPADFLSTSPMWSIITRQTRITHHPNVGLNILLLHSPTDTCAHSPPMHRKTLLVNLVKVSWEVWCCSHSTLSDDASPHQGLSFILLAAKLLDVFHNRLSPHSILQLFTWNSTNAVHRCPSHTVASICTKWQLSHTHQPVAPHTISKTRTRAKFWG